MGKHNRITNDSRELTSFRTGTDSAELCRFAFIALLVQCIAGLFFARKYVVNVFCSFLFITLFGPFAAIALDNLVADEKAAGAVVGQVSVSDTEPVPKLWEDDFSGDWKSRWSLKWINTRDFDNVVKPFEYDGETWVRVTYREGEVGGHAKFMTNHGPLERAYLEYKLRFAEDFDWVLGGKLPGFMGGQVTNKVVPDGTDGWSARFMWREGGQGSVYSYHPDQGGPWGETFRLDNFWFQKGVEHTIGLEVVMNTPGQYDGIIRTWLDGVLVVEETDMRFRDIPDLHIDGIVFSTFFGGGTDKWAPTKDEHIDFGDFKLYEAPRGRAENSSQPIL
jgi:hypothetical protein